MKLDIRKGLENSALKEKDGMNYEGQPILRVDEQGAPTAKVDPEVYEKDVPSFWRMHEQKLWGTIIIIGLYFVLRLLT